MAKERKVVFSLAVESGRGGTSAVDDLIRKMNEAKAAAQGATAAIREAARAENAARGAAARATVPGVAGGAGAPDRTFSRDFASGMRVGGRMAAEERRERERNLQELARGAERERQILQSRVRANIEASRRIRDAARETTAGHYRGRVEGFFGADPKSHTPVSVYGSGGIIAEEMYRKNMRVIDGYRQIGQAATQAARAVVLLGAANSESAQRALQMIGTFEAGVSILSAAKNLGGGLGKLFGGAGALGGLGGAGLLGTLGTAGAVALPVGMAAWMFADAMPKAPPTMEEFASANQRGRMRGGAWREKYDLARMGIESSVGYGLPGERQRLAQLAEMRREIQYEPEIAARNLDRPDDFHREMARESPEFHGRYVAMLTEAKEKAEEIYGIRKEEMQLSVQIAERQKEAARQQLDVARQVLQTEKDRYTQAAQSQFSNIARFGMMSKDEQDEVARVYRKAQTEPESMTPEELRTYGNSGFRQHAEQLAATRAYQNPAFKNEIAKGLDELTTSVEDEVILAMQEFGRIKIDTDRIEAEAKESIDKAVKEWQEAVKIITRLAKGLEDAGKNIREDAIKEQLTAG